MDKAQVGSFQAWGIGVSLYNTPTSKSSLCEAEMKKKLGII